MKNPFKEKREQFKQSFESFTMRACAYWVYSMLLDLFEHDKVNDPEGYKRWKMALDVLCDKYFISEDELKDNIIYLDNLETGENEND